MFEEFGPFFALQAATGEGGPWLRLEEAATDAALDREVERSRQAMAARGPVTRSPADQRALASTMSLGLCARLLSPPVAGVLTDRPSYDPDPTTLWLGEVTAGPVALRTSDLLPADPSAALAGVVLPYLDAVGRHFRVPRRILLGNAAAAVVGACQVVSMVDPALTASADDLRRSMLSAAPLAGTGTVEGPFVRTSCCQIHRLPMGYLCPNCLLVERQTATARRLGRPVPVDEPVQQPAQRPRRRPDFTRPPFR